MSIKTLTSVSLIWLRQLQLVTTNWKSGFMAEITMYVGIHFIPKFIYETFSCFLLLFFVSLMHGIIKILYG